MRHVHVGGQRHHGTEVSLDVLQCHEAYYQLSVYSVVTAGLCIADE